MPVQTYCALCLVKGVLQDPIATWQGTGLCAWHLVAEVQPSSSSASLQVVVQDIVRRLRDRASELDGGERDEYQAVADRVQYSLQQGSNLGN